MAVSPDGNTVFVGAHYDDIGANANQGSAYVYQWNGSSWSQQAKLTASDGAANDHFGVSIAASANGNIVAIGTYGDDSSQGSAYIYLWNGSNWSQQTKLTASDGSANDWFGISIAVSAEGDTVIAGAQSDDGWKGSAYVYRWNGSSWVQTKLTASDGAAGDRFGISVAVSAEGNTVAIGAFADDGSKGSAYIYKWNGSAWAQTKLTAFDGAAIDQFGISVSMSADGNTAIVGAWFDDVWASDQGSAYIYRLE